MKMFFQLVEKEWMHTTKDVWESGGSPGAVAGAVVDGSGVTLFPMADSPENIRMMPWKYAHWEDDRGFPDSWGMEEYLAAELAYYAEEVGSPLNKIAIALR